MNKIEAILKKINDFDVPEHERFELIEDYAILLTTTDNILQLIDFMYKERNAVLRHEVSAQLLRINKRAPELIAPVIKEIENALISIVTNDESIVSRHEAIEALSSLGGEQSFKFLSDLSNYEINKDIIDTIRVSLPMIEKRLKNYKEHVHWQQNG